MSLQRAVFWVSQEVGAWPCLLASIHTITRSHTPGRAGSECAPRPRRQRTPAKWQRVGDRSVRGCCRAQAGARPPYVETSQKAPPCPAVSCGACPDTTHGTSCRFRSVSEGCISRRGRTRGRVPRPHAIHATAAEPGSLRPPNRAPRTTGTIPSRLTTQKTRLERGQKPPPPRKHAKCTKRRTHLKHSTPTTQQARVGDTNGGFCVSR